MGKIQRESIEDWKRTDLARDYNERGRRKNEFKTESEIELDDAYTSDYLDAIGFDESKDLGLPGQFPYTRGIFPGMFRADLWIMGQYAGFGAPTNTNERFKYLLELAADHAWDYALWIEGWYPGIYVPGDEGPER